MSGTVETARLPWEHCKRRGVVTSLRGSLRVSLQLRTRIRVDKALCTSKYMSKTIKVGITVRRQVNSSQRGTINDVQL